MSDQYGLLALPVPTTDSPVGDPLLGHLGGFIRAVVNRYARDAWVALRPRSGAEGDPIRGVIYADPEKSAKFNQDKLPTLFVFRQKGQFDVHASDLDRNTARIRALWVYAPDTQEKAAPRSPFDHAVPAALRAALDQGRDSSWTASGDTTPYAATIPADADAIKTAVATSTSPQVYSGAALNGAIGGTVMSPRREPTITTANVGGSVYRTDQDIVVTAIDWYGFTGTYRKRFTQPGGGETIAFGEDVKQVVSVSLPDMLDLTGSLQIGTSAVEGRGSSLVAVADLVDQPRLLDWEPTSVEVVGFDDAGQIAYRLRYAAVAMTIEVQEHLTIDITDPTRFYPHDTAPYGVDINVVTDGLSVSKAALPDNAVD